MKWFKGKIPEAIHKSKQANSLFIVYVQGKNEDTQKMDEVWEDTSVSDECDHSGAVAINIQADSDDGTFFGQIYPVVVVPCTYFVGLNGVPLEVTGGYVEAGKFLNNIKAANQKLQEQIQAQSGSKSETASTQQPTAPDSSLPSSSQNEQDRALSNMKESADSPNLSEKVQRANELIAQKRDEKMQKADENAKLKEDERRKLGKDVQKLRQYQEDRERKELEEQMRKDREENKRAKERIQEQIARDREERAAKYKKEKEEQDKQKEEKQRQQLLAKQQAAAAEHARRSETARIQIRLPDGSSISSTFNSTDTLQAVDQFVSSMTGMSLSLSTTYPKRYFTDEDRSETLMSLNLAPTAVLIGVNRKRKAPGPSGGGGAAVSNTSFVSMLLAPFMMLWNFLYTFLFGSASDRQQDTGTPQAQQQEPQTSSYQAQQRPASARKRVNQPDGNIHRFRNIQDDADNDDDTNTWNGNSTQQM